MFPIDDVKILQLVAICAIFVTSVHFHVGLTITTMDRNNRALQQHTLATFVT